MDYFTGKVALVTGSSRGVGYATAEMLARRGAKIVISARGEKRLLQAKAKLEDYGAEVAAVVGDVGIWADAVSMVNAALDAFGRLDIVINNAGVSMRGDFKDLAPEVCTKVLQTNLLGSIYVSRAAVEHIISSGGHLVFVSSIAGLFGVPGASVYCASKAALTALTESLRLELGPLGVHVGAVHLGFTEHDPEKRILAADGSLVPPDRPAHHTQEFAASKILLLIEKRKKQLVMTPVGKLGWIAYRLSPWLVEKTILFAMSRQLGVYKKFS